MDATDPIEVTAISFSGWDGYITHDEDDAKDATLFTPGADVVVTLDRGSGGRWMFHYSDYLTPSDDLRERSWRRAADAFADLAAGCGVTFTTSR